MKNWIQKHWALVAFVLAFVADKQFEILPLITSNELAQDFIKMLGALVVVWLETMRPFETRGIGGRPNDRDKRNP